MGPLGLLARRTDNRGHTEQYFMKISKNVIGVNLQLGGGIVSPKFWGINNLVVLPWRDENGLDYSAAYFKTVKSQSDYKVK